jgi:hypothetical protein
MEVYSWHGGAKYRDGKTYQKWENQEDSQGRVNGLDVPAGSCRAGWGVLKREWTGEARDLGVTCLLQLSSENGQGGERADWREKHRILENTFM